MPSSIINLQGPAGRETSARFYRMFILLLVLGSAMNCAAQDHFARARELYNGGPSKAPEILSELNLELAAHPNNINAYVLKAVTLIGTNKLDEALATLDAADKQVEKGKAIYPDLPFYRAQALYYKGDFGGAKNALEPYAGIFLKDKEDRVRYVQLMSNIRMKLGDAEHNESPEEPKTNE